MILHPPSDNLETRALAYFILAKVWEDEDLELAYGFQENSQRMSPTLEGERYLKRLLSMRRTGPTPCLNDLDRAIREEQYDKVERALLARIAKRTRRVSTTGST